MIPTWLMHVAKGRNVVIALVLWFACAVGLFNFGPYPTLKATAGGPLLEERFGYSQSEAQEQLRGLGEEGRGTYRTFQLLDGVNAVLMAAALTLSLAFALSRLVAAGNPLRLLVFLPILAGVGELVENSLLLVLVSAFPAEATFAGSLAGPVTSIKLILGFTALPVTLVSLLALGFKTRYNRRTAKHEHE